MHVANSYPPASLLHPTYGSAARDIRAAVGVSSTARLDRALRQLDEVRRTMVLHDRDYQGIVITQPGAYQGHRITPDQRRVVAITGDETVVIEPGADNHELVIRVDTAVVCAACPGLSPEDIDDIIDRIAENEEFIAWLCDTCSGAEPGPWPGG